MPVTGTIEFHLTGDDLESLHRAAHNLIATCYGCDFTDASISGCNLLNFPPSKESVRLANTLVKEFPDLEEYGVDRVAYTIESFTIKSGVKNETTD